MEFTPHTRTAFNRLNERTLVVTRRGKFQGSLAVLTRCVDTDCPNITRDGSAWTGWFTDDEVDVVQRSRSWPGGQGQPVEAAEAIRAWRGGRLARLTSG